MAAKRSITFPIYATDKASPTMRGVGRTASNVGDTFRKAGAAIGVGLGVAAAAAVKFGVDSVRAFAAAEESQNKLNFAYEKFPALADVSIDSIRRLNSALALKTRFDDDATASAQAVLAQFGLTGQQLIKLTPLLQDYAARTGKDLTDAASDLGRALLGQGRALKTVGIDFEDTGTVAGNFEALMAGLSSTVGGFAERDAETAAGKLAILQNRFGEVQEAVGEALMPALDRLLDWIEGDGLNALEGFANWFAEDGVDALTDFIDKLSEMAEDGTLVPSVVAGIGAITTAQLLLNGAMFANPVGAVIGTLMLLVTQIGAVIANLDVFRITGENSMFLVGLAVGGLAGVIAALIVNWDLFWGVMAAAGTHAVNGVLHAINFLLRGLQPVVDAFNFLFGTDFKLELGLLQVPRIPGVYTGTTQDAASNSQRRGAVAMAMGGIINPTPGGTRTIIGEAGYPEAVIPLTPASLAAYGLNGNNSGDTIVIHMKDSFVGSEDELARKLTTLVDRARRRGTTRQMGLATP